MPSRSRPDQLRVAALAAFFGWLLCTLVLLVGARPLGWVASGSAVVTLVLASVYAHTRALKAVETASLTLAFVVVEWLLLAIPTLSVLSWLGVGHWE